MERIDKKICMVIWVWIPICARKTKSVNALILLDVHIINV